ncbi:MAG: outer membrane beta-barrel protein [Acidobacteriota bacterium]
MRPRLSTVLAIAILFLCAHPAFAGDFSIGAALGVARLDSGILDDDQTAKKAWVAYHFFPFLAVEGALVDLGVHAGAVGVDSAAGTIYRLRLRGANASVVGTVPLGLFSLYARAGVLFWDQEERMIVTAGPDWTGASVDTSSSDPSYGVGFRLNLPLGLGVFVDYDRYQADGRDFDAAFGGVRYRF